MDAKTAERPPARRYADLPAPPGLPLLGQALQIDSGRFHQQLEQWAAELGPFFRLNLAGRKLLIVADHEAVAAVLRDRPEGFCRTLRLQEIWVELGLPIGVFGANGEVWQRQRRMVMAGFDPAHVRRYFPTMQEVADRLVRRWRRAAQAGQAIALQSDLMRFTVDQIAGLAFGSGVNTLEAEADVIQRHLDKLFPVIFSRILKPFPTWRWWPSAEDRALAGSIAEILAAVNGFIVEARRRLAAEPQRRAEPANLLEAMIVAADEPGSGVDDAQVAGNVLTMLLAGEDTTANTLAWMVDLLWRHPAALARLQAEVREALDAGRLSSQDGYASLDYLDACAQETMRLKPVAPILPLQALREVRIGDVRVPAGTVVINLMRHDSVSAAHLERPQDFWPERWLQAGAAGVHSAKRLAMPFGAGPRICPGRYLALLEIKLALVALLGHFEIEALDTPDGGPAREHLAFTMAPKGLAMRLRERVTAAQAGQ